MAMPDVLEIGGTTAEALSKRRFCQIAVLISAVMQASYAVSNLVRGIRVEAALDLSGALLLLLLYVLIRKNILEKWGYRLVISLAVATGFYSLFFRHDASAMIMAFFLFPPVVFYLLGLREGAVWGAFCLLPLLAFGFFPELFVDVRLSDEYLLLLFASWVLLALFSAVAEWFRDHSWKMLHRTDQVLQTAAAALEELGGLLPICSYCKRIRDDDGYWRNLEHYLETHTAAQVSSGLCHRCAAQRESATALESTIPYTMVGDTAAIFSEEESSKRKSILGLVIIGVAFIWGFAFRDYMNGDTLAASLEFLLSVIIGVKGVLIHRGAHRDMILTGLMGALLLLLVLPFFGETEGNELLWFFIIPVIGNHLVGYRRAIVWSGLALCIILGIFFLGVGGSLMIGNEFILVFILLFVLSVILSAHMERIRDHYVREALARIEILKETYRNIKTVKGLVPVCASCKSIRDDDGYWTSLESYLAAHTELRFSHGICNTCLKEHYPSIYEEMAFYGTIDQLLESRSPDGGTRQSSLPPRRPSRTK